MNYLCCTIRSKSERRRNFIANQVEDCKDLSGLFYLLPFQKGYLVNWDIQRQIWDYLFSEDCLGISKPQDVDLIFTEPMYNFPSIQDTISEIFFEEYKFKSVLRVPAPVLSFITYGTFQRDIGCAVVVDSGYSFTHIVPLYKGKTVMDGVLRIDVGGKLLTNHLKEAVSYRQLHVLDETCVMNQAKEDTCYVALDFKAEMEQSRRSRSNAIRCEYVLPNFSNTRRGHIKSASTHQHSDDEQSLILSNERIAIPELLFDPSNVGIPQMGIAEAIVHSISLTPSEMHSHLYSNIILTGGNCLFSGFKERLETDVRKLSPDIFDIKAYLPEDPVGYPWKGGALLCDEHVQTEHIKPVSNLEYKEVGHSATHQNSETFQWTRVRQSN